MITKEDLKNENNLAQCECENWTHIEYITEDESGSQTCPSCQISFQNDVIDNLIKLVIEIADPQLSKKDIRNMIKEKYCKLHKISLEDFDCLGIDWIDEI